MTFPLVTAVSAQPWLDQVPCSQPLEETDNQKQWTQEDTYSFGPLGGAQQTKPQSFGICAISTTGRGHGQLRSLGSELEGMYGVGFSGPPFPEGKY